MLHPTWSGYTIWLSSQQSTVGILSDLDYNFNLISTWLLNSYHSRFAYFPNRFPLTSESKLQQHPPTRHSHQSEFLHQQVRSLLHSQLTLTPIGHKHNQPVGLNQQLGLN
jgi:hypothetical protein